MLTYNALICFTEHVGEFDILDENTSTQGVAYDYSSLMHLQYNAFAKGTSKTMLPFKTNGLHLGRKCPSPLDFFHMKVMYCEGNTPIQVIHYIHFQ